MLRSAPHFLRIAAAVPLAVLAAATPALAAVDDTALTSRASGESGMKAQGSQNHDISANGRYVVFDTPSSLDPADSGGRDVYVRDRLTDETILVSRASGVNGQRGNDDSAK